MRLGKVSPGGGWLQKNPSIRAHPRSVCRIYRRPCQRVHCPTRRDRFRAGGHWFPEGFPASQGTSRQHCRDQAAGGPSRQNPRLGVAAAKPDQRDAAGANDLFRLAPAGRPELRAPRDCRRCCGDKGRQAPDEACSEDGRAEVRDREQPGRRIRQLGKVGSRRWHFPRQPRRCRRLGGRRHLQPGDASMIQVTLKEASHTATRRIDRKSGPRPPRRRIPPP